jgi:plastocyanin
MNLISGFACRILITLGLTAPLLAHAQTTHIVTVGDNFFSPSQLTINVGDTVRWVNAAGGNQHNVRSMSSAWTPSQTSSSFTFEVIFNQAGTFNYECTIHSGMTGTITVQGTASAAEVELLSVSVLNAGSALRSQAQASGDSGTSKTQAFVPGDPVNIEAAIRNNGNASSGGFEITYYASTNSVIDTNDTALGIFAVANLAAGATRSQQNQVSIPGNLAAGQYFIGAILSFNDSNANNNVAVDNFSVTVSGAFLINAGLNDVWATPGKNGAGILFATFPDINVMFSAWFTYDSVPPPNGATAVLGEPDQRWLTMQGNFSGDTATLQIFESSGGVFDSANPQPGAAVAIGTMTIVFHDCGSATASYSIPGLGLMNTIPLVRIVADNIALCEEINLVLQQ